MGRCASNGRLPKDAWLPSALLTGRGLWVNPLVAAAPGKQEPGAVESELPERRAACERSGCRGGRTPGSSGGSSKNKIQLRTKSDRMGRVKK